MADTAGNCDTLSALFGRADREDLATNETVDRIAEERVMSHWDSRPGPRQS